MAEWPSTCATLREYKHHKGTMNMPETCAIKMMYGQGVLTVFKHFCNTVKHDFYTDYRY